MDLDAGRLSFLCGKSVNVSSGCSVFVICGCVFYCSLEEGIESMTALLDFDHAEMIHNWWSGRVK